MEIKVTVMKILLNRNLTDTIQQWAVGIIKNHQPRLSGEIENIDKRIIINLVYNFLMQWNIDLFLFIIKQGSRNLAYLINHEEIKTFVTKQIDKDETWSVIDIKRIGGCTFDVTTENGINTLFFSAWGEKETQLKKFASERKNIELFRSN